MITFLNRPHLLISCAWLLHAAAWLLPAYRDGVTLSKGLPGWEAFRFASCAVLPCGAIKFDGYGVVFATISVLTTLLFIFGSPWVVLRGSRSIWRASAWAAATAFLANAHWYVFSWPNRADLMIGYFLWWFSFLFLAVGLFDLAGQHAVGFKEGQAA